jgi:putative peptidoglycan lipid II flippase
MSSSAAKQDFKEMGNSLVYAIRHLMFLCVPIAMFTLFFRSEIISVIFKGGCFGDKEVKATAWAMLFYAIGIPAFAAMKITVNGFYARKDMKTPLKVSLLCIVVNIILNLILMWPLKQGGIALATVISSFLNNIILLFILSRQFGDDLPFRKTFRSLISSMVISFSAIYAAILIYARTEHWSISSHLPPELIPLLISGSAFVILYVLISWIFGCRELPELREIFRRGKPKS